MILVQEVDVKFGIAEHFFLAPRGLKMSWNLGFGIFLQGLALKFLPTSR